MNDGFYLYFGLNEYMRKKIGAVGYLFFTPCHLKLSEIRNLMIRITV